MNSKNKCIIFDIDDVLVDFIDTLLCMFNSAMGSLICSSNISKYDFNSIGHLADGYKGKDLQDFYLKNKHDVYRGVKYFPYVEPLINLVNSLDIVIILLTARSENTKSLTLDMFTSIGVLPENIYYSFEKHKIVLDIKNKYDIIGFIDDNSDHILNVSKVLGRKRCVLINKSHNKDVKHPIRRATAVSAVAYLLGREGVNHDSKKE